MDPVTAALVAALIGWISILLVVRLPAPRRNLSASGVRRVGAAAIAAMALAAFGLPIPMWVPLLVFLGGLATLLLLAQRPEATPQA